jgi:outer membrane receptor for ferrienterochelin and colicins
MHLFRALLAVILALSGFPSIRPVMARAQSQGTITGIVTRDDGAPLNDVNVSIRGIAVATRTDSRGHYTLRRVPAGDQVVVFRWLGFRAQERAVTVMAADTLTVDVALEEQPIVLSELTVEAPSRAPERLTDAPSAATLIDAFDLRAASPPGQLPMALATAPGVQVMANGVQDFNVSTRGFNGYLSSRVLVLQDGRDLALSLLGNQEWNTASLPMDDLARIELLRGPNSALYGANAGGGVLAISTPSARESLGNKATIVGGEVDTWRADVRHGGVLANGRFGYRLNAGHNRSDTWDRSRTLRDGSALQREYQDIVAESVPPGNPTVEVFPLNGQRIADTTTGAIAGDREPVTNTYGSARFDYYADRGEVGTVEGGLARSTNVVFMNGPQRVQLLESWRPWARIAWGDSRYQATAWWSGQYHPDGALRFLGAGFAGRNTTNVFHLEGRYNRELLNGQFRLVVGGSYRHLLIDTKGTGLALADDDRSDPYYAAFGQIVYRITPAIRAIIAGRFDDGVAYRSQWSPHAALVLKPSERHTLLVGAGRGFWAPDYVALFIRIPVGAADLSSLETSLRAGPLGPDLAGVPEGQLFTNSQAVPLHVIGNRHLRVQKVTSFEIGYRGELSEGSFVTLDGYYERFTDFLTSAFPGANPDFLPWTAPAIVPDSSKGELERQVAGSGAGLTRLEDGTTAIVLSTANAGTVDAFGVEIGLRVPILSKKIRLDGSYTYFNPEESDLDPTIPIPRAPNAPTHQGSISLVYPGAGRLACGASLLLSGPFEFRDNLFHGRVPARQTVNLNLGYQVSNNIRITTVATNVLNQRRFQAYGASVIGRRVVAGMTATF